MTIVPDFYSHSWEREKGSPEPALAVDFGQGSPMHKKLGFFKERQFKLKEKLTERCLLYYQEFVSKTGLIAKTRDEHDLIKEPLKYQQWHHSFDPNS